MALTVLPVDAKIKLTIKDVIFHIVPLSNAQKLELMGMIDLNEGKENERANEMAMLALRLSLKAVEGINLWDGTPYKLTFTDGFVDNKCLEFLFEADMAIYSKYKEAGVLIGMAHTLDGLPEGVEFEVTMDPVESEVKKKTSSPTISKSSSSPVSSKSRASRKKKKLG